MKNTVILFCSHLVNAQIKRNFDALRISCGRDFDVVWVYDSDKSVMPRRCACHDFTRGSVKKLRYRMHGDDKALWANPEFAVLDYFLKHPRYEYYWRVEYDVGFDGSWGTFFRCFLKDNSDFLATMVRSHKQDPRWPLWGAFRNLRVAMKDQRTAFFPIERFSRRALRLLDKKYKSGVYGFCEVLVPTLLFSQGLKIRDIGSKYYDAETLNYEGRVKVKPGKLCHPVHMVLQRGNSVA